MRIGRANSGRAADAAVERGFRGRARGSASPRSPSMSRASRVRSICCWNWRAGRRSTSRAFRSWNSPINISPSSRRRANARLELAADYLVMAAWLAYLKSRLLLPSPPKEPRPTTRPSSPRSSPSGCAGSKSIRRAAELLMNRPRLGRDVFARGAPESIDLPGGRRTIQATLYDLMSAYARQSQKRARTLRAHEAARGVVARRGARGARPADRRRPQDWIGLDGWLIEFCVDPKMRRSARASSFSASLEMVREGLIELRQDGAFRAALSRASSKADEAGRSSPSSAKLRDRDGRRHATV